MNISSKNKMSKKGLNNCFYHVCKNKGRTYKCKYCGESFCKSHSKPRPAFKKNYEENGKILDEINSHPCIPYIQVANKLDEQKYNNWKSPRQIRLEREQKEMNIFIGKDKIYNKQLEKDALNMINEYEEPEINYYNINKKENNALIIIIFVIFLLFIVWYIYFK
ncbi:hypothetical protein COX58_00295 [archaeon CG_4_10_14_0_2_um_filter_Archaea_38_6]|nr:MAG: hypothetical protein COX58_00295 [archaeon CG_4_10_14_0_2_um_filter_Archaea_38_6]